MARSVKTLVVCSDATMSLPSTRPAPV